MNVRGGRAWGGPVFLLCVLALAGCSGPSLAPAGVPVDAGGKQLPTLEGYVVDAAIRPMEGAVVRLLHDPTLHTTSDADGYYALRRPTFAAEDALVTASAPGHQSRTQQVQLSGHRSTRLDFQLERDPYDVARVEVLQQTDALACQARSELVPAQPVRCTVNNPIQTGDPPPPPNIWVINPDPGLAGIVVELHWDAKTPMSQALDAALRAPVAGGFSGELGSILAEATGASPLRLELGPEVARGLPRWTAIHVEVRLPDAQATAPASFTDNQPYDAYASLFYVEPAPPGYILA